MNDIPRELRIGPRDARAPDTHDARIAMLLWGDAGCGKTTLASTAPGTKLWLLFDNGGADVLSGYNDVLVLDLTGERHQITERFKDDDPLGIERAIKDRPDIETVVLDSVTTFALLATENAVAHVKSATIENPGIKGYGHRGALVLRAVVSLLRLTKRLSRHIILIAHEDTPDKDENGVVLQITTTLSQKMTNNIGIQLNEVWWMSDTGKEHRIAVRPVRQRKPMKSRMWDLTGSPEFNWHYNTVTREGDGLAKWHNAWTAGGGKKLAVPKA